VSDLPEAVLRRIVAEENPQRVILFGSRARGEAGPDSDYDLMVVLDDDVPETRLRRSYVEGVDVLRCRPSWLRDRAHIRGAFAATILREGQTIYARGGGCADADEQPGAHAGHGSSDLAQAGGSGPAARPL
jgi:uncharacterized protein